MHPSKIMQQCTRRSLSAIYHHRSLPATLIRLNAGPVSNLYEQGSGGIREHQSPTDAVRVSEDGLVRQAVASSSPWVSNGAELMPNTFMMQELVRNAVDEYMDDSEKGLPVDQPIIFTVPKGTAVPRTLTLIRENISQFSLQPREPMALSVLNEILSEFFRKNSKNQTADEWLDRHEFSAAHADDAEEAWMRE